ncbi:MAG: acyltransferase [Bacteroidales bacterium]|nr:acyltransferase [Bacteroidales bacterium]
MKHLIDSVKSIVLYPFFFKSFGKGSRLIRPLMIDGMKNIEIGERVYINSQSWIACLPLTGRDNPILQFGRGTVIGNYNHIYATQSIVFEEGVLTADKVYVADNQHAYEDVSQPVLRQSIKQLSPVRIGEGSWLGENVCVIGASVGKHCVIGANSVVTKDIPDYCVAVGAPARIVKKYDFEKKEWIRV